MLIKLGKLAVSTPGSGEEMTAARLQTHRASCDRTRRGRSTCALWLAGLVLLAVEVRAADAAADKEGRCDPAEHRTLFEEREGAGLKLLILRLRGVTPQEAEFGEKVARRFQRALEHYAREEGRSAPWKQAELRPEGFQVAQVPCEVAGHPEARALGRAWGADLILWGQVSLAAPPRTVRLGSHRGVTFAGDPKHVTVVTDPRDKVIIKQYFADAEGGTLTPAFTAVAWQGLEIEAGTGKGVQSPLQLDKLMFPELATREPLGLLHFMIGLYVNRAQRYALAAHYFERATEAAYAGAAQGAPLYWVVGATYLLAGEPKKGMVALEEARRRCGQDDKACLAVAVNNLAWGYNRLGEKQKSIEYYDQSLALSRKIEDVSGEATTLNNIGNIYSSLGEKQKALEYYNQALPRKRQEGNALGEATTLNNIGIIYDDLGEKNDALEHYSQALSLMRKAKDVSGEATILNNIGIIYDDLGEKQKALDYYGQALLLIHKVGDVSGEARELNNIGAIYDDLGEKQKALEYYNQALLLRRKAEDVSGEAKTLNNIGSIYDDLGEDQKALKYYSQALPLMRKVGDASGEAKTLNNIGIIFYASKEKEKALGYFTQALPLQRKVGDASGEATTLNNIGRVYEAMGENQNALKHYEQALPLTRKVRDISGESRTLNNIGHFYEATGEDHKALNYYDQALALLSRIGDRWTLAVLQDHRGHVLAALGRPREALAAYHEAISLYRQRPDLQEAMGSIGLALRLAQRYRMLSEARQLLAEFRSLNPPELYPTWLEARLLFLEGASSDPLYYRVAALAVSAPATEVETWKVIAQAGLARASSADLFSGCPGVLVTEVVPGSQASTLGLQRGDILLGYRDQCLADPEDLIGLTASTFATIVTLHRWRNGHLDNLTVHGGKLGVTIQPF